MARETKKPGLARLYRQRITREAVLVVAEAFGVSTEQILSKRRAKAPIVLARQLAMYLSHIVGQLSLAQVSEEFGRDRTTVGYSCHSIEDRRDSPMFDEQIDQLEERLRLRLTQIINGELERPLVKLASVG